MRIASAIVTEQGGKTSHAAIVSRELGVPCIVGAKKARSICKTGSPVTVSCAEGDEGVVYKGALPFEVKKTTITNLPKTKTKIMMNIGDPDNAFALSALPHDGIGLAREEFIFSNFIRIHPLALIHYHKLKDKKAKKKIADMTRGYKKKSDYCVDKLAEGIARIAVATYDKPVIIRLSDFKTNEYATLIGGKEFEPKEENPMLGWRGASRYYSKEYKEAFRLECEAIKKVRDDWGLTNVIVMVPFCRTPEEGKKVLKTMASFGLKQGENGLQVYVMCEIPSNVVLADDFAKLFDGFSIGSNDLTQLVLGVDRDSASVSHVYDENNEAVKTLIRQVIKTVHKHKKKIGICGQAPSDYPKFAEFLVREGIDSISLNPDTVVETKKRVAALEKTLGRKGNKTHKPFLGLVVALGMMAAGIMALGAGCVGPTDDIVMQTNNYVSPSQIRERAIEKITEQKEEELAKHQSVFEDNTFADLTLSYPSTWATKRWPNGIVFENKQTGEYVSLFQQLVDHPVAEDKKERIAIAGKDAWKFQDTIGGIDTTSTIMIVEISKDEDSVLELNGNGEEFQRILDSIIFVGDGNDSWNHWDVREKRVCVQMITYAKASDDASCQLFSTPCDVPDSWQVCDSSDLEAEE
ncbi:MAG: phosphoenolpyruvate synthase, partial [Candidatus Magasanikbacteria bacterium]|nr:phosphoenolpyruvate synthase [Candidatus Magasanikbacteria bacterium]